MQINYDKLSEMLDYHIPYVHSLQKKERYVPDRYASSGNNNRGYLGCSEHKLRMLEHVLQSTKKVIDSNDISVEHAIVVKHSLLMLDKGSDVKHYINFYHDTQNLLLALLKVVQDRKMNRN